MMQSTDHLNHQVLVWDLPTRLFHWLLVFAFIIAWLSQGTDRYLDIHVYSGYLFLGLLSFRFLWGIIGSHYAQFRHCAFGWNTVWKYLRTLFTPQRQHFMGHNPAGSWAVFMILGLGLIVSITGLLTLGGEEQHGPLAGFISFALGDIFHYWHDITAWLMLGLIGIHLAGVFIESGLHRENLLKAMITGCKLTKNSHIGVPQHTLTAILLILAVVAGTGSYFSGYLIATKPYLPFTGPKLPDNALWREECGDCHLAFHPSLLPARSWQRMLAEQHEHFGDDLDLDAETLAEIYPFAVQNAAESMLTEPAWKINRSTPSDKSPLRITDSHYWKEQHQGIDTEIWQYPVVNSKANCGACHLDAELGTFEDAAMRLPKSPQGDKLKGKN